MNPEMKSSEYHLRDTGPMLNISGFTFQCIANVSNIVVYLRNRKYNKQNQKSATPEAVFVAEWGNLSGSATFYPTICGRQS